MCFSTARWQSSPLWFDYELDVLTIAEVGDLVVEPGWAPGAGMSFPGPHPDRNIAPPCLNAP